MRVARPADSSATAYIVPKTFSHFLHKFTVEMLEPRSQQHQSEVCCRNRPKLADYIALAKD